MRGVPRRPSTADPAAGELRMSRLTLKRMQSESEAMNPMVVENDEDGVDLNFVVEGDFFDGNEFQPVIESEGT